MVPISTKDMKRAFGAEWVDKKLDEGVHEFFLVKRVIGNEKKWFILDQNHKIIKRTRSKIVLSKVLGTETHHEGVYEEWIKILNKKSRGI